LFEWSKAIILGKDGCHEVVISLRLQHGVEAFGERREKVTLGGAAVIDHMNHLLLTQTGPSK